MEGGTVLKNNKQDSSFIREIRAQKSILTDSRDKLAIDRKIKIF